MAEEDQLVSGLDPNADPDFVTSLIQGEQVEGLRERSDSTELDISAYRASQSLSVSGHDADRRADVDQIREQQLQLQQQLDQTKPQTVSRQMLSLTYRPVDLTADQSSFICKISNDFLLSLQSLLVPNGRISFVRLEVNGEVTKKSLKPIQKSGGVPRPSLWATLSQESLSNLSIQPTSLLCHGGWCQLFEEFEQRALTQMFQGLATAVLLQLTSDATAHDILPLLRDGLLYFVDGEEKTLSGSIEKEEYSDCFSAIPVHVSPSNWKALAASFVHYLIEERLILDVVKHQPDIVHALRSAGVVPVWNLPQDGICDKWMAHRSSITSEKEQSAKALSQKEGMIWFLKVIVSVYIKPYWLYALGNLFCNFLVSLFEAFVIICMKTIFDQIGTVEPENTTMGRLFWEGRTPIQGTFVVMVLLSVLAVARTYCGVMAEWIASRVGSRVGADIRRQLFETILRLPKQRFDSLDTGDVLQLFGSDISVVEDTVATEIFRLLSKLVAVFPCVVLMFWLSFIQSFILIILILSFIAISRPVAHAAQRYNALRKRDEAKFSKSVDEEIALNDVIRLFSLQNKTKETVRAQLQTMEDSAMWALCLVSMTEEVAEIFMSVVVVTVNLGVGAALVARGLMTVGDLAGYQPVLGMAAHLVRFILRSLKRLLLSSSSLSRLEKFLREDVEDDDSELGKLGPCRNAIEFRNVYFGYKEKHPVIKGCSFSIAAGQRVAVVGPSGCGKSSILGLLLKFYSPSDGSILIDGTPLEHFSRRSVRKQISYVMQEAILMNDTILENIRLLKPYATVEEVEEVAKKCQLHSQVRALPAGYETVVGERGANLSGGLRQRISIARSLLVDPDVVIFDEPTSALDATTERDLINTILKVTQGKTVLYVTHRLEICTRLDLVMSLKSGQCKELGTHEELLRQQGVYASLWEKQMAVAVDDDCTQGQVRPDVLKNIFAFALLHSEELEALSSGFHTERVESDTTIFPAGVVPPKLCFIANGTVDVMSPDGELLSRLSTGDVFGEAMLARNLPTDIQFIATSATTLLSMPLAAMKAIVAKNTSIEAKLRCVENFRLETIAESVFETQMRERKREKARQRWRSSISKVKIAGMFSRHRETLEEIQVEEEHLERERMEEIEGDEDVRLGNAVSSIMEQEVGVVKEDEDDDAKRQTLYQYLKNPRGMTKFTGQDHRFLDGVLEKRPPEFVFRDDVDPAVKEKGRLSAADELEMIKAGVLIPAELKVKEQLRKKKDVEHVRALPLLLVRISQVKNVWARNNIEITRDPFCRVTVGDTPNHAAFVRNTKVLLDDMRPKWDQGFVIPWKSDTVDGSRLRIELYDDCRADRERMLEFRNEVIDPALMGSISLDLRAFPKHESLDMCLPMEGERKEMEICFSFAIIDRQDIVPLMLTTRKRLRREAVDREIEDRKHRERLGESVTFDDIGYSSSSDEETRESKSEKYSQEIVKSMAKSDSYFEWDKEEETEIVADWFVENPVAIWNPSQWEDKGKFKALNSANKFWNSPVDAKPLPKETMKKAVGRLKGALRMMHLIPDTEKRKKILSKTTRNTATADLNVVPGTSVGGFTLSSATGTGGTPLGAEMQMKEMEISSVLRKPNKVAPSSTPSGEKSSHAAKPFIPHASKGVSFGEASEHNYIDYERIGGRAVEKDDPKG